MVDLSPTPVMGRFSGENPLDWVIQTEKYFIFYNILSKHKLSWASFYLDGEALEWYRWLFRNKQLAGWDHFVDKLFIRFQSRKVHDNRLDFLQQFTTVDDYQARTTTIPSRSTIANSPSPQSWNAQSDYTKLNSAHQVFDKFPEKYHTVDAWDFTNRGITGITAPDDIVTPQNERSKSIEVADLVHESSAVTKDPKFAEISYTTASSNFHVPNASVHDEEHSELIATNVSNTHICGSDGLHAEVTIPLLNESSHNIKFREIRSRAPRESLLVPFDGSEVVRPHEHLERNMSMRYVDVNSLASGSPKWKTDLETFDDWYLSDFFMEPVGNEDPFPILTSLLHSVKLLLDPESENSTQEFNGQHILSQFLLVPAANLLIITITMIVMALCVWDRGICLEFMALRGYTETASKVFLLGCIGKFFSNADSNSMSRVWDPGQPWPCANIGINSAEQLVVSMFSDNWSFKICSHRLIHGLFVGRRRGFVSVVINGEVGVLHDFDYVKADGTGALVSPLDNRERLHYISFRSLVYFWRSSTRIVYLDKWFSGQRLKDVQMPRHNDVSWRGNSGLQDGKYIDFTMFKNLLEVCHNAGDGLQLSLPPTCVLTMLSWSASESHANYETVVELNHVKEAIKATFSMIPIPKVLWPTGHLEKLQSFSCHNHIQCEVNYVDTINKAWYETLYFAQKGLVGACYQMHFVDLEVNVTASRLPMLLLARFLDLNLEDKVLIEDGSIVMNQSQPNKDTKKDITQIDIGPCKSNWDRPSQRIIWDPGPIINWLNMSWS